MKEGARMAMMSQMTAMKARVRLIMGAGVRLRFVRLV
jgi:hypothetical protein